MNKTYISAILAVTSLTFNTAATAQTLSKSEYHTIKKCIADDYKSALSYCASFADSSKKSICITVAKNNEKLAVAELDASYQPSDMADYKVSMAKATTDYTVSKEKCNEQTGNIKDVCLKEAQSTKVDAESDAQAQLTMSSKNATTQDDTDYEHDKENATPFPVKLHGYL